MSSIPSDTNISAYARDYGRWIDFCTRIDRPALRLLCLHHAGGSALAYRDWHKHLTGNIEVCPIELPRRGRRHSESWYTNLTDLSAAIASGIEHLLDVPFALFGYSMGATVAFETVRQLERKNLWPQVLLVAGASPPGRNGTGTEYWKLPRERLMAKLQSLNGTPEAILADTELMDYFLAILRSDFHVLETHRIEPDAKVSCPIRALAADQDQNASPAQMAAWGRLTTNTFFLETFRGDHSFVLRRPEDVIAYIRNALGY